jgi:hypothetical protein
MHRIPQAFFPETTSMDAPVKALNTEKAKALQAALAQIEKQFGKGSIMRLGDGEVVDPIESCPPARSAWTLRWASAACRAAA